MLLRRRAVHLALATLSVLGLAVACGGGDAPPPLAPAEVPVDSGPPPVTDDGGGKMQPIGASCTEAEWKDCKVLLPSHGDIHPCFVGCQYCVGGKWGECIDCHGDAGPAVDGSSAVN